MNTPVNRQRAPQRACVVHVELPSALKPQSHGVVNRRTTELQLEEAVNLADALALEVLHSEGITLSRVNPRTLIGSGRVEMLAATIADLQVDVVIVNTRLTPTQQRNLELDLKTKVIDRTGLILEIFGDRARTHAGRLQVELAALTYQQSRLVRTWTHLERQRGGLGKTGGPGERQIELDRRMIRTRIKAIKDELAEVEKTRALHRKARTKAGLPSVALVGYTNAGKSTMFNALVGDASIAQDMLFATLDPLMRKMTLPNGREIILSDTVGFISDLPHELVEAFHATLEEVSLADLLIHVHDGSSDDAPEQDRDVKGVLKSLGADKIPVIDVCNKMDLMENNLSLVQGLECSALTGKGVPEVLAAIEEHFAAGEAEYIFTIPAADGKRIAWLHAHGDVTDMQLEETNYIVKVRLSEEDANIFRQLMAR
ncbi:MAG: GTPase HflX [Proteobacteria bacterium]|nr:GTPase HflX [Pseudomonadota bacterium]